MLFYVVYVFSIPLTVTSSNLKQSYVDVNALCNRDQNGTCITCKYGIGSPDSNCECSKKRCSNSGCSYCSDRRYYPANGTCCRCSVNCKRDYCTSEGECRVGCKDGFFGIRCDKLCITSEPNCKRCLPLGTEGILRDSYGMCDRCRTGMFPDLEESWWCADCPNSCIEGECDPVTGSCTLGCVVGHWSSNCNKSCEKGCHSCRQTDGICEAQDCMKPGFEEGICLTNCNKNCKKINGTGLCMTKDGSCFDQCEHSFYGAFCNISCQSSCNGSDNICERQSGYCLHGCDDGFFGPNCSQPCLGCSINICEQKSGKCFVDGLQDTASHNGSTDAMTYLLIAGVPIACAILAMGIVTPLVSNCIKKRRNQNNSSLYGRRRRRRLSTDVDFVGSINSDAYAEINEENMFTNTSIENNDTTKPVDITPVSIYMTVPLDEGVSVNVGFDDSMTTYQRLSKNEEQDDLNTSTVSTMNGEYLTVVHEWPTEPKTVI
ncbi:SREC2-like protein [Mya arenaria]|uniref:SREC2-like protein n=1 Tax=Mya arenaria TaxID=6604 RepID=A0ABY7FTF6_MYAAR|nr:scavenger receptor class F member 1-like [Mya arenaria]WAR25510.1 SREC2-like protein [Mya arenaria]